MGKALLNQRSIYKLTSSQIKRNKGNVKIDDVETAIKNRIIVPMSDSDALRMLRIITKSKYTEEYINNIKSQIKENTLLEDTKLAKKQIKKLIKEKHNASLEVNICNVVFDSDEHYDKYSIEGFKINGKQFELLIGTSGGIKNNVAMFCTSDVYSELERRLCNGMDKAVPMIPSKLMAYKALAFSGSTPVSYPNGKILVVKDSTTKFKDTVLNVKYDSSLGRPTVELAENYDIEVNSNDGCGIASPRLMRMWQEDLKLSYRFVAGCFRNSFFKGMISEFDFHEYVKSRGWTSTVEDVWGNKHNIFEVDLIVNESMLKCWKGYKSIEDYIKNCKENGYNFAVTKAVPKTLDNQRMLNYQYLQCLNLSDLDINNLIKNDIQEVKEVLGLNYKKTILFGKGTELNDKNVWNNDSEDDLHIKALMINPDCINDEYVRGRVKKAIRKRIDMMKTGKINVNGNYQISIGEPVVLLESIFDKDNVNGLLKRGEFYIEYWRRRNTDIVGAFRSPQSCKENCRKFIISHNEEAIKWYGHLFGVIIFNAWDTTMMAMNGQDMDGDLDYTTDNKIIINGIEDLPSLNCFGESAEKTTNHTREDYRTAIKSAFGNKVGSVTNYGSSCYDKISMFDVGSREYDEIDYRIKCIQFYQQECIDSAKNGKPPKPIPQYWHNYKAEELGYNSELEKFVIPEDKDSRELIEFYNRVLTEKKPYFFRYIYDDVNREYLKFKTLTDTNCGIRFRCTVDELKAKEHLSNEQTEFLKWYEIKNPLSTNPCIVNKIAWIVEKEFDSSNRNKKYDFDYSVYYNLESETIKDSKILKQIKDIYADYKRSLNNSYAYVDNSNKEDNVSNKNQSKELFKDKLLKIIPNEDILCNTLIYLGYEKGSISTGLVWIIVGNLIIKNLLKNNNNVINYPTKCKEGDLRYKGDLFKIVSKVIVEEKDDI